MSQSDAKPETWDDIEWDEDPTDEPEGQPAEDVTPEVEPEGASEAEAEAEAEAAELETEGTEGGTPEADDAGETEAEPSSEEESPSPEDAIAAEAEPTDAPDESTEDSPFVYRADGEEYPVEGAHVVKTDDGREVIEIPKDAWQRDVQPRLANRSTWDRERDQLRRQVRDLSDPERNPVLARAQTIVDTLDPLLDKATKGDPEELYNWLENVTQNAEVLRARAEAAAAKADARRGTEVLEKQDQAAQQEQWEQEVEPRLRDGLRQHVGQVVTSDFEGLGLDVDEITESLWTLAEQGAPVFYTVTEENAQQFPDHEPGVYANLNLIRNYLTPTASTLRRQKERREKAQEAKAENDRALKGGKKKPPTAVAASGSPSPEKEEGEPESYDEWVESL